MSQRKHSDSASRPELLDHSLLPRFGLKGSNIHDWLDEHGYQVGATANQAYHQNDGSLVARLSARELLFLCDSTRPDLPMDHDYFSPGLDCYTIRRHDSHYWYAISGRYTDDLLATLCGVDFDPGVFANKQVAQTRIASTSVIAIRHDDGYTLRYNLLGDRSYAVYMWKCLQEAMLEF